MLSPRNPGLASRGPRHHHHHPRSPPNAHGLVTTSRGSTHIHPPARPSSDKKHATSPSAKPPNHPISPPSTHPISTIPSAGYAPRTRNPSVPPRPAPGRPPSDEHAATGKDGRPPGTKRKPHGAWNVRAGGNFEEGRRIHILVEGRRVRCPFCELAGCQELFEEWAV